MSMEPQKTAKLFCNGCHNTLVTPLFCFSCSVFQHLNSKPNYYAVFGIPYSYSVDLEQLEVLYQNLAAELHPDFYANASPLVQKQSESAAALLNLAYDTLQKNFSRATYLLKLLSDGEDLDDRRLPQGFLAEMFEFQETLDEMLGDAVKKEEVKLFKMRLEARFRALEADYSALFSSLEEQPKASQEIMQEIQTHINAERYIRRLYDRCELNERICPLTQ